jgi:hypothetical protein
MYFNKPRRKHKYGATKTKGYDSKKESKRADVLKWMQRAGNISELREQVAFDLAPKFEVPGINGKPVCVHRKLTYIADFVYIEKGETIVEDCKGFKTKEYKKKKNLMRRIHGIEIKET